MKLSQTILYFLSFFTLIHAFAVPNSIETVADAARELYKRKGGGGGRGGGGGGTSSGGGRGSGSTGSSGSSGSRGSGSSGSRGSGVTPSYGGNGGRFYGGGATQPYRAGSNSRAGLTPYLAGGAALGALGGVWLYGAYAYNYPHYYTYHNDTSNSNETHPATCLCGRYAECGCDQNSDQDYINTVANNASISTLAEVNNTETLVINGTLPNGTIETYDGAASGLMAPQSAGVWVVMASVALALNFM